ncbi:hypothetical protein PENTCL1PPCAC_6714 [Pristionchus entomophagus]|uniref:HEAT repeat-containing protein 1 n=1 Tax=Pristionchus entomophagus TaxID=358040 RepID=A0AAV5ST45_9BILA|nr:hypothetical protein PENTCL1PPCAC_6714 [Pristionchus entomophagus]
MTSLSRQLEALSTAASLQLGVEAQHPSLLFDRKEAAGLDRETVHKIGCTGFEQLLKLDSVFSQDEKLFDENSMEVQRLLLSPDEASDLNMGIERFLVRLSPYLQHFAAQQALEWLIYKYHIHSYNAEFLIVNFLPFHESNIYGRLLGVLNFKFAKSKEWCFMTEYAKKRLHIPFSTLLKNALSGTHVLLSQVISHLERCVELVGDSYVEGKCPILFAFLAKLLLETLNPKNPIDDSLLSKIIPVIANGIRSKIRSLRYASLMVICQLSLSAKLTEKTLSSILKLLIMKLRTETMTESISTIIVLTQQQKVESFSVKATIKMLRRDDLSSIISTISLLGKKSDLTNFYSALWSTLLEINKDSEGSGHEKELTTLLVGTLNEVSGEQASILISLLLNHLSEGAKIPQGIVEEVHPLVARFSDQFETIREEWKVKDAKALSTLISLCNLDALLMVEGTSKKKEEGGESGEKMEVEVPERIIYPNTLKLARKAESKMAEEGRKEKLDGDAVKKCLKWIEKKKWEKLSWALDEMSGERKYVEGKLEEDLEDLLVELMRVAVERPKGLAVDRCRDVMSMITIRPDVALEVLTRQEGEGSAAKKKRNAVVSSGPSISKYFANETDEIWNRRLILGLQVLCLTPKLDPSPKLLPILFSFIASSTSDESTENGDIIHSILQSTVALLLRLLNNPGSYRILPSDLRMEVVVSTMRTTLSHHLLRDSLRLLTAAVKIAPSSVVSHVLSIFTFMGSGLLKKDNELTLTIMEDTLNALFHAVVTEGRKEEINSRLVSVCKILAVSINDIPAHRRARASQSISRAVGPSLIPIVLETFVEGFCAKWQKATGDAAKSFSRGEQEAYEEMACELVSSFPPVDQLAILLDLIVYIIRLGGDTLKKSDTQSPLDRSIFDRSIHSLPRLRHYRFLILGVIVRVLCRKNMIDELASMDDSSLSRLLLPLSHRLLSSSVDLDDFSSNESAKAEQMEGEAAQHAIRYWMALASRSELVADKLRHMLPGSVAGQLIISILRDPKTDAKLREKALQLANVKLMSDGGFSKDGEENDRCLNELAATMNAWIAPARVPEKIVLCQNAAFSLKLIAKNLRPTSDSTVLATTMEACTNTLKEWSTLDESLVGNTLLLAGELIRCHNMRSTLMSAPPLMEISCAILAEILATRKAEDREKCTPASPASSLSSQTAATPSNRRARIRQQSLCGKRLGGDTMLICALTCTQRLLDDLGRFVSSSLSTLLPLLARLAPRFGLVGGKELEAVEKGKDGKGSIEFRLQLIRKSLLSLDLRLVLSHAMNAAKELRGEQKCLSWILSLLSSSFPLADRLWLSKQSETLLESLFRPLLEIRSTDRRIEMLESMVSCESEVTECLNAFAGMLSETELRPLMASLVEWAGEGLENEASLPARLRLVSIFHMANGFYSCFNTLSLVYFGRLFEMAAKTLQVLNYTKAVSPLYSLKKNEVDPREVHFLILQILLFIQNCAKQTRFFSSDRWKLAVTPLIDELENSKVEGHETRCLSLADTLYPALECHSDTLGDTLQAIMVKVREGKAKLRYRCLLVLERLGGRIGEGLAPHLPLLMPYLSELMEDENRAVEEQTERVVRVLQKKFGEDISEGFM